MQGTISNKRTAKRGATSFEAVLERAAIRRPIQPKSLIMTIFGDSVVPRGGVIWLGSIVELAREFGFAEPLVRTSALRLTYDGWLLRRQVGKLSYYSMTDDYAAAQAAYQSQIYSTSEELRRNGWTIFRMFADRIDRKAAYNIRNTLNRYGFGQLAPLVLIHPSIGKSAVRHIISISSHSQAGVAFFAEEPEQNQAIMRHLIDNAWDLTEVRQGYEDFIASFGDLPILLEKKRPSPPIAFALRTLMVHHFRRTALRDPRLPEKLLPANWPGEKAFGLIKRAYTGLLPKSEAFLDLKFRAEDGIAPKADERLFQRFSGAA